MRTTEIKSRESYANGELVAISWIHEKIMHPIEFIA